MTTKRTTSNDKFYARQKQRFDEMDRQCVTKRMSREQYRRYAGMMVYYGIKVVDDAYGLSRGQRGVLLTCPLWTQNCWVMFTDVI